MLYQVYLSRLRFASRNVRVAVFEYCGKIDWVNGDYRWRI
jgi:hypothetical protein